MGRFSAPIASATNAASRQVPIRFPDGVVEGAGLLVRDSCALAGPADGGGGRAALGAGLGADGAQGGDRVTRARVGAVVPEVLAGGTTADAADDA